MAVSVAVRAANDQEIADAYRADAQHITAVVDGMPVAYVSFRMIDYRMWGIYMVLGEAPKPAWHKLFYALRQELQRQTVPVFALARDKEAARLLGLLGLEQSHETYAGKDVWIWTPQPSI